MEISITKSDQNDFEIKKRRIQTGFSDYLLSGTVSAWQMESSIRYSIQEAKNLGEIKQLNEALAREKEMNELKSSFVSMASHEFRTPLAYILTSLSCIKKYGELGQIEKQDKHITRINSAVFNLTDILSDFLSIGKLEEGKVIKSTEEFNIKTFVSETTSEMQSLTDITKIVYAHSGKNIVSIDKKFLKNILTNLVSNAIKFSGDGKKIEIISKTNKSFLTISVKDNGIGISKADQTHLFERFFRGHNASQIQGTGLGLNIVAKYVELMNGSINVSSEENEGTTFTLTFPQ